MSRQNHDPLPLPGPPKVRRCPPNFRHAVPSDSADPAAAAAIARRPVAWATERRWRLGGLSPQDKALGTRAMANPAEIDKARRRGRESGGREARRAARGGGKAKQQRFIQRKIPVYEILSEEGLALCEANADTVLQEIGIEFRDDAEALQIWKDAGADVDGVRVRCPKGMCREHHPKVRARELHPARPQPGALASRSAATPRSSRRSTARPSSATWTGPALRHHRGLPQLREARLHGAGHPPLRRHGLRAGRHPGQQAPPGHGLQPHALFRPALHGLGDGAGAGRGHVEMAKIVFGEDFVERTR